MSKVSRLLDRGAESRASLLDAAVECFARNGFEGTSIREIADEAGVTFQLIRYHFGSKEDLWTAAAFRLWDRAQALLERALSPPEELANDPRKAVRHFVSSILEHNARNPHFRRVFTQEFLADSERYRNILKPYLRKFIDQQLEALRGLANQGAQMRCSAEEALLLLRSLVAGTVLLEDEYERLLGRPARSKAALEYQADLLVSLLFDGCGIAEPNDASANAREASVPRQA